MAPGPGLDPPLFKRLRFDIQGDRKITYSPAAKFEQNVYVVFVVEEIVKTDDVIVLQTAMNTDLLCQLFTVHQISSVSTYEPLKNRTIIDKS